MDNNPPMKKTQLTVRIPDEIMAKADKYINQRRFESRSDMISKILSWWLEFEHDEELWEIMQKHEQINQVDAGAGEPYQIGNDGVWRKVEEP